MESKRGRIRRVKRREIARSRLYVISFVLLAISTQSFAQNQEAKKFEEEFYRLYPDLKAHNEVVRTAFDQLNQSGFQAKTQAVYNRALAIKAYVLLNQSSGAKMPYRLVLGEYDRMRSDYPALKDMSLPEFVSFMNEKTGSRAFDEGLNQNWLRRVGANVDASFVNSWGFVILVAGVGLIFLFVVFRVTARPPAEQQSQSRPTVESSWRRAIRPAGVAAKWVQISVMIGTLSVFRAEHLNLLERIGFTLVFSVAFALIIALPVYLIAVLSYATGASRRG